ncbi:response regulator [Nonomuraea deserti]|uniref:Response regulator n=1 Tax=Nonomuraea deserti TaxID=1848322 RepID=A0A4R4VC51_9ACTN|nr:LuxR C-terminal-related transcriptional regulator [Nonomuraea deserti]TDD01107.1 response regulator [Nonomuraea deserti]
MRIVIAEDAGVIRDGLSLLLTGRGHEVAAAVGDAAALCAAVAEHRPDVAVVDIRMPPTHTDEGLRAAIRLRGRAEDLRELTDRERDVLALMAEGRSNAAIASALFLSYGSVEKHVTQIFAKLGLPPSRGDHRRVLAVLRYLEP